MTNRTLSERTRTKRIFYGVFYLTLLIMCLGAWFFDFFFERGLWFPLAFIGTIIHLSLIIWMLVDCSGREFKSKKTKKNWMGAIMLFGIVGVLVYFIKVKSREWTEDSSSQTLSAGAGSFTQKNLKNKKQVRIYGKTKSFEKKNQIFVIIFFVSLLAVLLMVFGKIAIWRAFDGEFRHIWTIRVGMSEDEILNKLGTPDRVYYKATAPVNYYVDGYIYKIREIDNKVLIWIDTKAVTYVYLDTENRVEDLFIGGDCNTRS